MFMSELNDKEKKVLYQLVRNPLASSREMAGGIGLSLSTTAAIKRRLKKEGYFKKIRIPCVESFGIELLSIVYTQFLATRSLEERLKIGSKYDIEHPNVFWIMSEQSQGMSIQFSENLSEEKKRIEQTETAYTKSKFLEKRGMEVILFPLELTELINFFDYSFLLNRIYHMDDKIPIGAIKTKPIKLSASEKKIYLDLIKYPDLSDQEVAKKAGTSRFTVLRSRKNFENRIMKTRNMVNLEKLNFGLIALFILKFSLSLAEENIERAIKDLLCQGAIFLIRERMDCVALIPFETFDCYRAFMNSFSNKYKEYQYFSAFPEILLFSLAEAKFPKRHVYAPLIEKLLNIGQ